MMHFAFMLVPLLFASPAHCGNCEENEIVGDQQGPLVTFSKIVQQHKNNNESDDDTVQSSTASTTSTLSTCDLLGPEVEQDLITTNRPPSFVRPKNLQNVKEFHLPVGFHRLRRAMLSSDSEFWLEAVLKESLHYTRVETKHWDHHNNVIGKVSLPPGMEYKDFIGAKSQTHYLRPKSIFIGEHMAHETSTLAEYNDNCFAIRKETTTPDVPFGSKFVALTQIVVLNMGHGTCKMICSSEAQFPKGPPMGAGWQIKNAMKVGTFETFGKINDAIHSACFQ